MDRGRALDIGWHGATLAVLLIGAGVLLAMRLNVSEVTPERGGAVLIPTGFAYYLLWRYGVSFLNSVVCVDEPPEDAAKEIT